MQVQYYGEFERDRIKSVGLSISDGTFGPFDILVDQIECVGGDDYRDLMREARTKERKMISETEKRRIESS